MIPAEHILLAVRRYHFLTTLQAARLLGYSHNYTAEHLRDLVERKWLKITLVRRSGRGGSSAHVYTLDTRGRAVLRKMGYPVTGRFRTSDSDEADEIHMDHTLAVNNVIINAELIKKRLPSVELVDVVHERDFKRTPIKDGSFRVEPDGWLDFHVTLPDRIARDCVWLELDRDKQDKAVIRKKVRQVVAALQGPYLTRFETDAITGVVFVTTDTKRRDAIVSWIGEELTTRGLPHYGELFFVTHRDPVESTPEYFWTISHWRKPFSEETHRLLEL